MFKNHYPDRVIDLAKLEFIFKFLFCYLSLVSEIIWGLYKSSLFLARKRFFFFSILLLSIQTFWQGLQYDTCNKDYT